ncbi:YgiQ family radical SAM protein [Christensenellaceae bacterium 44-20]
MYRKFLPISKKELEERGIGQPDFILVTPDAYVDHPSFANALIGRYLENLGYSVAILAQPNYGDRRAYQALGRPRLAFLVSGGNMDSMVNLYSANRVRRKYDMYSPGGEVLRPRRAVTVYSKMLRECYPDVPIIIGGIEASLRRLAHYDYWDNRVMPSVLVDSGADLLVYGMGEKPLAQIAEALAAGIAVSDLTYVRGTAYLAQSPEQVYEEKVMLPSFEQVAADKTAFAKAFAASYREQDYLLGRTLVQQHGTRYLVQNPPAEPLSEMEFDDLYELPFTREAHPSYQKEIPALKEVKFSLVSNRGCYGGCAFCAIFFHQGRYIQSRSVQSLVREAEALSQKKDFKGYIHDVGGPTANFTRLSCKKAETQGMCPGKRCLAPKPCPNLIVDHSKYLESLRALRKIPGVKKVFVRSGVRYDYAVLDKDDTFIRELACHHTSGQMKVAPEHCSSRVLNLMGKPDIAVYEKFKKKFEDASRRAGKRQHVLPYFICSHPGSTLKDAIELAEYLNKSGFIPDQVQDFYPTPGSVSTCMYYTGLDPFTLKPVYTAKTREERAMQRALFQFNKPENYPLVKKALIKAGREDLIGPGQKCLIKG